MHLDKAPSPDGMGPDFYQHHWDIVGLDIVQLVKSFFETEDLPLDINETNLVLIPKKKNFSTMGDLRPIALWFSSLIRRYEADRIIQGCRVANGAPSVTHMFFVDGNYLFCQATQNVADSMNRLLHSFELASGQRVNATKSSIFFSPNTNGAVKYHICSTLGMPETTYGSFYLGLPNIIGRKKTIILGFLKNKIIARINSWDVKSLWQVFGRERRVLMAKESSGSHGIDWLFTKIWEVWGFVIFLTLTLLCLLSKGDGCYVLSHLLLANIWSAQHLVRSGVRRIIGTGTATSILAHPWLPDNNNPFVTSTTPGLNQHTVISLFHVHTRSWNDSLVRDMFNVRDSTLILSIPLSFYATNNHWAWIGEKTGHFSVKSAYKLLQTQKSNRLRDNNFGFWRKLWHLKIPPKVKNFMWRAVSDVLPTCLQLVSKGASVSPMCLVCHHTAETATHILLNCPFALACRQNADLVPYANFVGTIEHFLHLVFTGFNDDISCCVVMLCWSLWKARNTLVWDKKASSPPQVVSSAWTILDHWLKAQDKMSLLSPSMLDVGNNFEHWTKPVDNTIKINVDGATFENVNAYGYSIVARDSEGNVIDFVAKYFHGSFSTEVVEALGVKEALSWLKDKGWNMVEVETDSLLTVQSIFNQQHMTSVFGLIIYDCKSFLSSLPNVSLCFVKRSANKIAHYVARRSCFYSDRSIYDANILVDYNANL
uniref:Uncharacterized protein n=1 Tax=Cannabis sativa TaxID=3483 RepID=A0A803NG12_CANSA